MIQNDSGKPELTENDPEGLSRLLEAELAEKRTAWKQATARYHAVRSLSFFFLFVVIAGALFAFFIIFSRVSEQRASQRPAPAAGALRQ
jgi:hypothetical protein